MNNNSLTSAQKYRLFRWVDESASQDKTIKSYQSAADRATLELGFHVTYSNAQGAYEATDTAAPGGQRQAGATTAHAKIRTIARAVVSICMALGHKPENYAELLKVAERKESGL